MAGDGGAEARTVESRLEEQPYAFDFFQAVRQLQCAHPKRDPVGATQRPADDPVRFCQSPSLSFASSTISGYQPATGEHPAKLFINFLGLLGPNGPMPLHVTEYAMARQMAHDSVLSQFLDVFNHRMVSLLYRAWACTRQAVNFERGQAEDRFAFYMASLFGLGMPALRGRDAVPDLAKLHFSGRLALQSTPPEGLAAILEDYFRVPADLEEFVGQWIKLPAEYCCRLGESPDTGMLGRTLIVGNRVWECQQNFRLHLGPMDFDDYQRLLPGGDSLDRLVDWVRNYAGDELAWDVQLTLKKEHVPPSCLGKVGQLGWSSWMLSGPVEKDADDLVLMPFAARAAMQNAE